MYQFCFNDCIPKNANQHTLVQCLIKTLKEYNNIKKTYPEEVDGIVISTSINDFILNTNLNYSLSACVADLPDKDLRTFAYRILTKHPIEGYFSLINEEDLLQYDYTITIAGTVHTAFNHIIVATNNGVLFSLGLHDDIRKDVLTVCSNSTKKVDVNNLYGFDLNTTYVDSVIKKSLAAKFGNFEKLLAIIGENSYSSRFEKSFNDLTSQIQQSIIDHFEAARNRKGISPFFADKNLIKDVSQEGISFRVFELRIFDPVAFRVYFYEAPSKTYLAMAEKKPADKKQDSQINAATCIISEMLLMER